MAKYGTAIFLLRRSCNREGWLDNTEADKRFMVNTALFRLAASDTQDIVVAYVVGQLQQNGNSSANVAELKRIDATAQSIYDGNFFVAGPPPHVDVADI
ncbi:MAG: hypothetical protein R3C26_16325 [Calditrichia bacterium]